MASVSKRQQARNEKELQELIQTVPGNNQCADCQARNPGWASWSLGIFLCMRCASIHRKLGTHISKVKSLSMDTWTTDQVERMKRNGNVAVNKIYNPKNKRPDIPIDADEVDSAMERFIRKKYQEKSLLDGKPQPPSHGNTDSGLLSKSPENSPPPPLPPKKGKFFGFGLRASSSAYPLSKHDKKNLPREPRVDSAFRISSENYDLRARAPEPRQDVSDQDFQSKLATLRDMGFRDERRNTTVLRGLHGDLERTVESLVKIQQVNNTSPEKITPTPTGQRPDMPFADDFSQPGKAAGPSTNPFDQPAGQGFGLSFGPNVQQEASTFQPLPERRVVSANNPFEVPARSQTDQGLEQTFGRMQVSQSLFPHSTGGYPTQPPPMLDPRFQQSMTPPVPLFPHQYSYTPSPPATNISTNPFFSTTQSPPVVANNPYASLMQSNPSQAVTTNPFFGQMPSLNAQFSQHQQLQNEQTSQHQMQTSSNFNPFGIPPSQPNSPQHQQTHSQLQNLYEVNPPPFLINDNVNNPFNPQMGNQTQFQHSAQIQQQPPPNTQFSQQMQYQQANQLSYPGQQQVQYQSQPQMIAPQQTGRFDKSSILALYNYPHLAPRLPQSQPLASIPEPSETLNTAQSQSPITSSPADLFGAHTANVGPKRSVTMPVSNSSSMHSASGATSRNPFLVNRSAGSSGVSSPMTSGGIGSRHVSADSINVNNAALESGRHSPDAFASLSARNVR